ncbi:MAG: hypothetical protein HFF66_04155 [Oscillospiraceae bacterium]|jgi:hypothetical protein|nr:hypothetical protein [Oscillospiraceae bacterium]
MEKTDRGSTPIVAHGIPEAFRRRRRKFRVLVSGSSSGPQMMVLPVSEDNWEEEDPNP